MKTICSFVLALAVLSLAACKTSVTSSLQLVVSAADAAVGVLEATGTLPPDAATRIDRYLAGVSDATSFAATELASSDSAEVKALKIAQKFATVTAPQLPPGTPQTVLSVIQSVVSAVLNFLQTIQPLVPPGARSAPVQIKVTDSDRKVLTEIDRRAQAVKARLAKVH